MDTLQAISVLRFLLDLRRLEFLLHLEDRVDP